LGGVAGSQPVARRLLFGGSRPARRCRADLRQRHRRRVRRDPRDSRADAGVRWRAPPGRAAELTAPRALGPLLRASLEPVRGPRPPAERPQRQRDARLRRARRGAGDHARRAAVVRAPTLVAPHLRRGARSSSSPAHSEGSYPHTSEALRAAFSSFDPADVRAMVETNAARFYGFDLDRLRPIGARIGPRVEEVRRSLPVEEYPADSTCNAFERELAIK